MLLATGVILLQLSAVMSGKPVAEVKPPVRTMAQQAAVSAEPSDGTTANFSNLRLTALNFADSPETSFLPKGMVDTGAAPTSDTPDAAAVTPIHVPTHVPKIKPEKQVGIQAAEQGPRRTWLMLALAQHGAAAFDAYSTRYAVGHGAVEENPLMRPFVHSDSIYAVSQVTPVVMDLISRRMMRSQNGFIRHMWFVPQTLSIGTYVFAGAHNFSVASRQR